MSDRGFCAEHRSFPDGFRTSASPELGLAANRVLHALRRMRITNSFEAYEELRRVMTSEVEEFWVVGLRSDKSVIECRCLFRGTVDACMVHPRDIFRFACQANAAALLIAHNHPSEDSRPSPEDLRLTRQLIRASRLFQIPIIDHLILTRHGYSSLADMGCL